MADELRDPRARVQAVIQRAVRASVPDLPEDDLAQIELHVDSLAALLREGAGRDTESADREARSLLAQALRPPTGGNAGWVEILDAESERALGRGQMILFDASPDSDGYDLAGTITNIRLSEGVPALEAGVYLARFEENGETRRLAAVSGQHDLVADTLAIVLLDEGVPISIRELSAGE